LTRWNATGFDVITPSTQASISLRQDAGPSTSWSENQVCHA